MTARLEAGPLSARLTGIDLARIASGGHEFVRRIGVRVREPDWGTVAPAVERLELERAVATFTARHAAGAIDFEWRARIELDRDAVVYEMDGVARSGFDFARIGIVILHPPDATAGHRYRARTSTGAEVAGILPDLIGPQLVVDGEIQPLFPAFTRLEIEVDPDRFAVFEFEGDVFEMEDQRNWTDGSFKTYSTPVGLPVPHHADAGQRIRQRVCVSLPRLARVRPRSAAGQRAVELSVGPPLGRAFPAIGIGADSDGHVPGQREADLLRELRAAHVRVELQGGRWRAALDQAADLAVATGAALELALIVDGDAQALLQSVADTMGATPAPVARVLLTYADGRVAGADAIELARRILTLPPGVPLVTGTAANFAELNRDRPQAALAADGLTYAITPQVHDFDDESIMQTLPAQRDTVVTARSFAGGRSIHVSPVTLRPRLDRSGDPRQRSPFTAAWTAGSAAQLALGGAASVTYYEATGGLGVMARPDGSREADVYPVFHVLRELCAWGGAELLDCDSSDPERVFLTGVTTSSGPRLLVANLTPEPQRTAGQFELELEPYSVRGF